MKGFFWHPSNHSGLMETGCLPESDHLTYHDPQGGKDGWGHGHGSSELLGGTFPQVHGLDIHAQA